MSIGRISGRIVGSSSQAIDCDVHPTVPGMKALLPCLDEFWRETVEERGIESLETVTYPPNADCRAFRLAAGFGREPWRGVGCEFTGSTDASATWRVGSGMLSAANPSERGGETLE